MARCTAVIKVDIEDCENETQAEIKEELEKLIDTIGAINVLALLNACNKAKIDITSPYSADFIEKGYFIFDSCIGYAVNVDQKRFCQISEIYFGTK